MKCLICKQAETNPGVTTVTLERGGLTLVVKEVPAQVCPNCGEAYADEDAAAELLESAEVMARSGTLVDIRQFMPA
ncbi:MAG: type II toxin-antitoxin system MqsA family antitoxin [Chloroflexota bacterium]|nr:type II toxin-antitoxin system MqsA family antitoxin [Chloroflexota bacterium]